ncbi:MAG: RecQ family zinc-binding domain-containing protein [Treponema sp.]|nr:RecQ family zinc-binding domain-containing protein [Treponema sp.]
MPRVFNRLDPIICRKKITFYATSQDCLRSRLLSYFGESAPSYCGNCSNCGTEFEETDITIPAQKILSCVYRIEQRRRRFGKTTVIEILRLALFFGTASIVNCLLFFTSFTYSTFSTLR